MADSIERYVSNITSLNCLKILIFIIINGCDVPHITACCVRIFLVFGFIQSEWTEGHT